VMLWTAYDRVQKGGRVDAPMRTMTSRGAG
jgi:hypothetical protein